MNSTSYHEYLAPCCTIVRQAGELIMAYFNGPFAMSHKEDNSPVTEADIKANQLIVNALSRLTPHIPIIAEEDEALHQGQEELFWLVDPLDGTRSFVRGEPEFTVNIGLIRQGKPWLGVIYAPPQKALYYAEVGKNAYRVLEDQPPVAIHTRIPSQEGLVVVRSRSHPSAAASAYLKTLSIKETLPSSSSIKFCQIAEGSADIYPRFGRTMEWDTAAGHAILQAAGGRVETADGKPLLYGKSDFENPSFIAFGKEG